MTKNLKKRTLTSILLFLILFFSFTNNYLLGYVLMIVALFSVLEFFGIMMIILKRYKIIKFFINLIFIFYIFYFCTVFLTLSSSLYLKILIFIILLTCVASDIGGFVFGKIFKGPKLTKISPRKTISGAIGSLIFSATFAPLLIYYLTKNFEPYVIIIGIVTSISCQAGDLFFSFLKRKSLLKDTGNFLPGHGGILDRIDGMLLGMPVGFLTLLIVY
jgi:phosphatidate cytidylyltransferase